MSSEPPNSPPKSKIRSQQSGFALAEMALTLPLFVVIAAGALNLSRQFHLGLTLDTRRLNTALSDEQMPASLRQTSHWPSSIRTVRETPAVLQKNAPGIFHSALKAWLCLPPPIPAGGAFSPAQSIDPTFLLTNLEETRNRALSSQRAACLFEASVRSGPQASAAVLFSILALPSENARRQSILSFCPLSGRIGELARQRVVVEGLAIQVSSMIPERKKPAARYDVCD